MTLIVDLTCVPKMNFVAHIKSANRTHRHTVCSCDLDLDPMTLIYEFNLSIQKMYLHAKNELYRSRLSKVRARQERTEQDRHTDRQTDASEGITTPQSRIVIIKS